MTKSTAARSFQVTMGTEVLGREGGSVMILVWNMKSSHYTRTLSLPPRDGGIP
jgi:hypothetical protein